MHLVLVGVYVKCEFTNWGHEGFLRLGQGEVTKQTCETLHQFIFILFVLLKLFLLFDQWFLPLFLGLFLLFSFHILNLSTYLLYHVIQHIQISGISDIFIKCP